MNVAMEQLLFTAQPTFVLLRHTSWLKWPVALL
jgi:hypothetical protein